MAKFTVRRIVDAYVNYEAEVEAASANEATELARRNEENYVWEETSTATFDARSYVALNEDGSEIAGTQVGDL